MKVDDRHTLRYRVQWVFPIPTAGGTGCQVGKAQEQSAPLPAAYDVQWASASTALDKSLDSSSGVRTTGGGRETGKKVPQG
jgi:hypothetical protein